MRLPRSLTPEVLSSILSYSPTRWRRIEQSIIRKHPEKWEPTKITDPKFSTLLHEFLQDYQQRISFDVIANRHSSKRKNLGATNS